MRRPVESHCQVTAGPVERIPPHFFFGQVQEPYKNQWVRLSPPLRLVPTWFENVPTGLLHNIQQDTMGRSFFGSRNTII